jgi:hypothetical protein
VCGVKLRVIDDPDADRPIYAGSPRLGLMTSLPRRLCRSNPALLRPPGRVNLMHRTRLDRLLERETPPVSNPAQWRSNGAPLEPDSGGYSPRRAQRQFPNALLFEKTIRDLARLSRRPARGTFELRRSPRAARDSRPSY